MAKRKELSGPHSVPQPRKERGESYRLMRRRIEQAGGPLNFLACYRCIYSNGECDSGQGDGCISGNLAWLKQEANEDAEHS